jgi:hypothetical protein
MTRWEVFAVVRMSRPVAESVVDSLDGFRPDDEDVCIWRDSEDPTLLSVTIEVLAEDMSVAVLRGRELAQEAIAFADFDAEVEDVGAEALNED